MRKVITQGNCVLSTGILKLRGKSKKSKKGRRPLVREGK